MRFRFERNRPLLVVNAVADGPLGVHRVYAAIDTGCHKTLLTERLLQRLGYGADFHPIVPIIGVGGWTAARTYDVLQLKSVGIKRTNVKVVGLDLAPGLGIEALLGLDFFRGYRLCVDTDAGLIDIEPSTPAS
jgi:predicted aspartyl protease